MSSEKKLKTAFLVTFLFMVVEWISGAVSGSLALMSDAGHMTTDTASLFLAWMVSRLAMKKPSPEMSYGFKRAEILGAFISGLALWLVAGLIGVQAFQRLQDPKPIDAVFVIVVSVLGLILNLYVLRVLRLSHHHHDHGHDHDEKNLNVHAASLHVMMDILGSVAALVSGLCIYFLGWMWIDPVLSFVILVPLLYSSGRLVRDSARILMESSPDRINPEEVRQRLMTLPGVVSIHDLHLWTVSGHDSVFTAHVVSKDVSPEMLKKIQNLLDQEFGIHHATVQLEHVQEQQKTDLSCQDCT